LFLQGIYAPIATPFSQSGEIDFGALESNFGRWLESGLDGIVAAGSNGEWPLLKKEERTALFSNCARLARGRIKVLAGVHCPSTAETIEMAELAADAGVDGLLLLPPHYYRKQNSRSAIMQYFTAVADASPVPVVIYNMPGNTGVDLCAEWVCELSFHENIVGVKDSSANIVQIATMCRDAAPGFGVFAGSGSFFLPSLSVGCTGGTMGIANLFPDACRDIMESFNAGDTERARRIQLAIIGINQAVTVRFGVPGLKAALDHAGLFGGNPRPPLQPVDETARNEIIEIYNGFKDFYRGEQR